MAQSTILAAGNTAATSTDIVIAKGDSVIVGIFAAADAGLSGSVQFRVTQKTPGADNSVAVLTNHSRATVLSGPGTFRVIRPAYAGSEFGVFLEA